jgi:hypothetical protein
MNRLLILALASVSISSAATLYVSITGDNSNSCLSGSPCRTIARASSLTLPGDVVQIGPGIYEERTYITRSGSAGMPITYRGHSGTGCPSVSLSDPYSRGKRPAPQVTTWGFYIRADFIRFECLKVVSVPRDLVLNAGDLKSGFYIHTGRHDITINDNVVDGTSIPGNPSSGIGFGPLANTLPYNVKAARNYVRGTGYGFLIYCATNCTFEDNEVEDLTTSAKGVDLDYTRVFGAHITIRRNYFHGNSTLDCLGCHIDCFQTWNLNQYKNEMAHDIRIEGNVCFNAHQGIILRDQSSTKAGGYATHFNWTVSNNVFAYGPAGSSMAWCSLFEHGGNIVFRHNLCYGSGQVGYLDGSSGVHEYNIHYGTGTPYNASAIAPNWAAGSVRASRNVIYTAGKTFLASSYPNDIVNVDPKLTNPLILDFRPASGSPAMNTAVTSPMALDRLGVRRPQGGAPDIGPYEIPTTGYTSQTLNLGSDDPNDTTSDAMEVTPESSVTPDGEASTIADPTILEWDVRADGQISDAIRRIETGCMISTASILTQEAATLGLLVERASETDAAEWKPISGKFGLADGTSYGNTALSDWNVAIPAGSAIRIRVVGQPSATSPSRVVLSCK